jgi:nucleoside-diphosphate-sugar epimerase
MSRVAITGAGGFIGARLTEAFAATGFEVQALVGAPNDVVKDPPAGVRALRGDIVDEAAVRDLVDGCDTVVHLAGPPSVGASFDDPQRYVHAHVAGTTNVLQACRSARTRRLVYVSSAEIYGNAGLEPVKESARPDPRSPYAAAKLAAEEMIRAFIHFSQFTACILRPFSVYGPRQPAYSLVPTIVRQAREGDAIRLFDLKPVRDYCYVDDLVNAIGAACRVRIDGLAAFNIGSGIGTSVRTLAQMVLAQMGRSLSIEQNGTATRPQAADIYALVANIDRATTMLDWSPRTSLADGLRAVVEDARD